MMRPITFTADVQFTWQGNNCICYRATSQNLIFAEGLASGQDIMLLPKQTLNGNNIVYAIHPHLNATNHHTPADWDHWFGNQCCHE